MHYSRRNGRCENVRIEKGFALGLVIGIAFWNACSKRFPAMLRTFTRLALAISLAAGVLALATAAQASPSSLRDLPQEMQGAVSGALGLDDRSYHVQQAGENCRGVNAAQQFEANWSEGGLAIEAGKLTWGLRLEAWGYGDELAPAGRALPQTNEHRVEYHRSGLTEWYVNGPLGIEQGFTVLSPPRGTSSGGALTVRLAWSGEARVQVEEQSAAVVSNFAGEPVLRYSGLSARDASGRGLRTWLEQRGAAMLLRVDDREATYPVVIDPLIQQQKLTASDGAAYNSFGFSVSLSGDGNTALIGAFYATVGANAAQGAAYVFVRSGGTWSQQQKLTASDGASNDNFGISVSLSADGSTAMIGAPLATVGAIKYQYQGAAYVFVISGGTWSQQEKLTASDGAANALFGNSVSLSGDGNTALIGAYNITVGANTKQGAAYVYVQSGSLTVTIGPSAAVNAGAMWNVDGGNWQTSGTTVSGITVGSHTVAFNNVTGWTTPSSQTANITDWATASLGGSYVQIPQSGSLTVTIGPYAAVNAGALWNVDRGSTWYVSGAVVPNLSVSMHTIGFNNVQGWTTPSSQTFNISNGATTSLTGTYVQQPQSGSLTVTISPAGAMIEGAMWTVDGGAWQACGATVCNLSVGSHTVGFNSVQGWITPSSQTANISNGQTASAIGTYADIFNASITSGKAPLKVHFTNCSAGSFTKWLWHFGDGKTSKVRSPNHTYSRTGVYTVTLTVTGAGGTCTCTQLGDITVYATPKANFSASPRSGDAPLQVNFTNESSGLVTS